MNKNFVSISDHSHALHASATHPSCVDLRKYNFNVKHPSWCADTKVYIHIYQSVNHDQHVTLLKVYTGNQVWAEGAIITPYSF
jgi:hypothetical protein